VLLKTSEFNFALVTFVSAILDVVILSSPIVKAVSPVTSPV
jgi:hypothetical protein